MTFIQLVSVALSGSKSGSALNTFALERTIERQSVSLSVDSSHNASYQKEQAS